MTYIGICCETWGLPQQKDPPKGWKRYIHPVHPAMAREFSLIVEIFAHSSPKKPSTNLPFTTVYPEDIGTWTLPCLRKHQHLDLTLSFLFLLGRAIFGATLGGFPADQMRVEAMPIQQAEAEPTLMPNHIIINMSSIYIIYIYTFVYLEKTICLKNTHIMHIYILIITICIFIYIYTCIE